MPAIQLTVTSAGLDALVDAQNGDTDPIVVAELGLASAAFTAAPTLEALPHEFKRIDAIAGTSVSENIIHMVAQDSSVDVYSVYGIGLFLADGTLFAAYAQEEPIVNKVSIASFLIAFDIAFLDAVDVAIEFGDASFIYPPATETVKGVAEIATNAEADAGVDDQRIMTPKKVKRVLDALAAVLIAAQVAFEAAITAAQAAFETAVNASIAALQARTITGGGLVTGGGDLTANRVLTVTKATGGDFATGTGEGVITADLLSSLPRIASQIGSATIPGTEGLTIRHGRFTCVANGVVSVTFVPAFPTECYAVIPAGGTNDPGAQDNFINLVSGSTTASGFQASNGRGFTYPCHYIAVGR
ncbi:MAG: hypothetical protein V4696_12900 [Pseudomonadota bacterium]